MEKLMHYVWKQRLLPATPLCTTDGTPVEVIDPGLHNHDAGPDFFNAKVRIGGTLWAGNVEMHLRASDWFRHRHDTDPAYNSVILHVVTDADCEVTTADGKQPLQMVLPIPPAIREDYAQLCRTEEYPRCWPIIPKVPPITVHAWMSALLFERLNERSQRCLDWLDSMRGDWERTAWVALSRNFGFGLNGDAFELWARRLPLSACAKHRNDLFQLEALFLGTAGLLDPASLPPSTREAGAADPYFRKLGAEYAYLAKKFTLDEPMAATRWRYLRLRPQNFPHLRLAQLATLYYRGTAGFATLMHHTTRDQLHAALDTQPSDYWQRHYLFGMESKPSAKRLSEASRDLLIVNTVVPLLFAHGVRTANESAQERAIALLESLKAEQNFIIRQWQQCGLAVANAADSQALIQLKRNYCDRSDCLRCRFGYEYLKKDKS